MYISSLRDQDWLKISRTLDKNWINFKFTGVCKRIFLHIESNNSRQVLCFLNLWLKKLIHIDSLIEFNIEKIFPLHTHKYVNEIIKCNRHLYISVLNNFVWNVLKTSWKHTHRHLFYCKCYKKNLIFLCFLPEENSNKTFK